jgi:hypothetical protein
MVQNRQRGNDRAAPRGHFVEVEKEPTGKEKNLWRNRRHILPGELAEQGQIEAAVSVDLRNPPESENVGAGLAHPRGVRRVSGKLEGEVSFDRRIDLARSRSRRGAGRRS